MELYKLKHRSLIRVSGEDSKVFLQNQLSNDISKVNDSSIQINALCQHQGKIIALLWVFLYKQDFLISIPKEMTEVILNRLNFVKFHSRVDFEDITNKFYQYGVVNVIGNDAYKLFANLGLIISEADKKADSDLSSWNMHLISNLIPEVLESNSEKFIPQALNLDIGELGVSFNKGCYPGQEVVARMHYLGTPKRRLFRFKSNFKPQVGDKLNVEQSISIKSSGEVIRVVEINNTYHLLATIEVEHLNDEIFLNNDREKILTIFHDK